MLYRTVLHLLCCMGCLFSMSDMPYGTVCAAVMVLCGMTVFYEWCELCAV